MMNKEIPWAQLYDEAEKRIKGYQEEKRHYIERSQSLQAENERLREERQRDALDGQATLDEANNTIVKLRDALKPFAEAYQAADGDRGDTIGGLSQDDFERAIKALADKDGE